MALNQNVLVNSLDQAIAALADGAGNLLVSSTSAPAGTEQALIVRNVPSGTQAVSAAALPLPSGAATSANQTNTQGSVAPGTAAANSDLVGAVYTSAGVSLTNGQQVALQVDAVGNLKVSSSEPSSASSAITSVAGSASSVSLLVSNAARKGFFIYNDSTKKMYLKFGATASATSFTVILQPDGFYEHSSVIYTGAIDAIWASAAGFARITELS
jgi:hypothetical protein